MGPEAPQLLEQSDINRIKTLAEDPHWHVSFTAKHFLTKWGYIRWHRTESGFTWDHTSDEHFESSMDANENKSPEQKELDEQLDAVGMKLHEMVGQPLVKRKKVMK